MTKHDKNDEQQASEGERKERSDAVPIAQASGDSAKAQERVVAEETPKTEDELKTLNEKLEKAESERNEYLAGWQRSKADFINYQKDERKRQEFISQFATEDLIEDLISVLDSFDLAISSQPTDEWYAKGLSVIKDQMLIFLKKRGLTEIHAKGQKFDPNLHESLGEVGSDAEENTVVEELTKGYQLHNKVIRPAKVKISTKLKS